MTNVTLIVNGETRTASVPAETTLLCLLRESFHLTDENVVEHNVVLANRSFGIATISTCLTQPDVCLLLDIDPFPDGNQVTHNVSRGTRTAGPQACCS